ncbi:MAG: hypothetical protein IT425_05290 [Pirellulales bacterium]|nr:hypothetical protein [Pirellulales bacterium]
MNLEFDLERLNIAYKSVRSDLLAECSPEGFWRGETSSSPVATAAAVSALVLSHRPELAIPPSEPSNGSSGRSIAGSEASLDQLVRGDLSELLFDCVHWLARRQNDDGGWGDCDGAESNVAATMLVQSAFRLTGIPAKYANLMARADAYLAAQDTVAGLRRQLGRNKPYVAAILANCALADCISWRQVPALAFEWHCLPRRFRGHAYPPGARYSAPIALAAGIAKFHQDPPTNPLRRFIRHHAARLALGDLEPLQATDGSYLASPFVTALVVVCLAGAVDRNHPIVRQGVEFLLSSMRCDASWAIVADQSITNTAHAVESLLVCPWEANGDRPHEGSLPSLSPTSPLTLPSSSHNQTGIQTRNPVCDQGIAWLLHHQQTSASGLTGAPAGGWAASSSTGAMPSTTATGEVLLALARAWPFRGDESRDRIERAARRGVAWMLDLQSADGGWSTYCREDADHPVGGSCVDATAIALRALAAWQRQWKSQLAAVGGGDSLRTLVARIADSSTRAVAYFESCQRDDGSFVPRWFGNAHQPDGANLVLGTAQVLAAFGELDQAGSSLAQRAATWLTASQHISGGWGPPRLPVDYSDDFSDDVSERKRRSWRENDRLARHSSIEETAAAVVALLPYMGRLESAERAVQRGVAWLATAIEEDRHRTPATLGFTFGQIWYHERLYPLVTALAALAKTLERRTPVPPAAVLANS